jgi:hypothetical protein
MDFFLLPGITVFTFSIMLMAGFAILQVLSTLVGLGISDYIDDLFDFDSEVGFDSDAGFDVDGFDADADVDADIDTLDGHYFGDLLSWLQFGKVPFLIILSAFLAGFGFSGWVIQSIAFGVLGFELSGFIAIPIAIGAALPFTHYVGSMVGTFFPKEETYAIKTDDLVGSVATITVGTAKKNMPSEARVDDKHGSRHLVYVVPVNDDEEFTSGTEVLLISRTENGIFNVLKNN